MRKLLIPFALAMLVTAGASALAIDFETIDEFVLGAEDYELAGDYSGCYGSGNGQFSGYHYTDPWDYWGGFAASNRTVVGEDDSLHQYTSVPGTDHTIGGGGTYGIGYNDYETGIGCLITFEQAQDVRGAWFTNVVWTAEYMAAHYAEDNYYRLTVTAYDSDLDEIGSRQIDLTGVTEWKLLAMNFEAVHAIGITMDSDDDWTPYYFCIDDISSVPEPSTIALTMAGVLTAVGLRRRAE
jgi:hypothetical protein